MVKLSVGHPPARSVSASLTWSPVAVHRRPRPPSLRYTITGFSGPLGTPSLHQPGSWGIPSAHGASVASCSRDCYGLNRVPPTPPKSTCSSPGKGCLQT